MLQLGQLYPHDVDLERAISGEYSLFVLTAMVMLVAIDLETHRKTRQGRSDGCRSLG